MSHCFYNFVGCLGEKAPSRDTTCQKGPYKDLGPLKGTKFATVVNAIVSGTNLMVFCRNTVVLIANAMVIEGKTLVTVTQCTME